MSCSINTNCVVAVYALGEWHPVAKGSFDVDAYEVYNFYDSGIEEVDVMQDGTCFQFGEIYTDHTKQANFLKTDKRDSNLTFRIPSPMDGATWQHPDGHRITMALQLIQAWKEEV